MSKIGVCGDNCSYCPRYIATLSGSAKELEKVKELWVRLGWRDESFPAEELTCEGCSPAVKCAYPELRDCAYEKEFPTCGICDNYPCKLVNAAFERTKRLASDAVKVCTPKEMDILNKAFLYKKRTLDEINLRTKETR
ncbi:MAG: DUF3795 domain-containing protein [candidate division WOR-3 bacterium]|jgi:hypothetical protein